MEKISFDKDKDDDDIIIKEQDPHDIIIKCGLEEMAQEFFKDYEIIWHDPNVNSQENQQYLSQLENLCKVKTFTEWKKAEDYIKAAKTICHVITSGTNGEFLVKEIFSSQNVPKIFTFCRAKEYHSTWTQDYEKILCTETKIEDVISQIQNNLLEWQKQTSSLKFDLPAFATTFIPWDGQILNLHLYLKVLPRFKNWKQAKKDLVSLSKRVYPDKKHEKHIADFGQNYNQYNKEAILKWYTQQSFLYKVINNCLRIATSDSIQWSRLLLRDIEWAIKEQYQTESKDFSGLLYRAAYLSEKEWAGLKENLNQEVEMHGFLSASKEKTIALNFMGIDSTQKVFITIIVPKCPVDEQGFAEIDQFSKFPREKEVLFNVRSRFTVLETEDEYSQDLPYRHLVLLYGTQGIYKFIIKKNLFQRVPIEDIEKISCSHCKIPTGKMTEKLFFMSITDPEKRIYSCQKCLRNDPAAPFLCIPLPELESPRDPQDLFYINLGPPLHGFQCERCGVRNKERYFVCTDESDKKMKWCRNCFESPLSCINMEHSILLEYYPFNIWSNKIAEQKLGHFSFQLSLTITDNEEFQQALMFEETFKYEKAVEFYEAYMRQNESKCKGDDFTRFYDRIGYICDISGKSENALFFYLRSLRIRKYIHGERHPSTAASYNNISLIYTHQREYRKALKYHFKSLEINISVYGESHPDVANCYSKIGFACRELGERKGALGYYFKSLVILKSIYGESHPEIASSAFSIGKVYEDLGEYQQALKFYLKSAVIYDTLYGPNDFQTYYANDQIRKTLLSCSECNA